ncbi:MAG: AAA family ATPase, partial [Dysgonamonadaceae bacterium]|nr:AAA family ATPase [Dysgonamonadaceae bacterium]
METFITKIYVKESRGGVRDLEIPLSETQRQHLIITGKNGSGKTGLLENIKDSLSKIIEKGFTKNASRKIFPHFNMNGIITSFDKSGHTISDEVVKIIKSYLAGEFLLAHFGAKRTTDAGFNIPKGIEKVIFKQNYGLQDSANKDFIQYFVNLKADRLFAKEEHDIETVKKIDEWFDRFEKQLKAIFNVPQLKVAFDRLTYNFTIEIKNEEPFDFYRLSDGYSAIISIVTELLLRTESFANKEMWLVDENGKSFLHKETRKVKSYDMQGIVLIDEIETHLHVELQKRILPFLIAFFPKI